MKYILKLYGKERRLISSVTFSLTLQSVIIVSQMEEDSEYAAQLEQFQAQEKQISDNEAELSHKEQVSFFQGIN